MSQGDQDNILVSLIKAVLALALGLALIVGMGTATLWGPEFASALVVTDTAQEIRSQPDPSQRHHGARLHMLELTNQHRAAAGVPPVKLGGNPAAQLHAEASLDGCYSSHWDRWGLKPNHRYTLTGGTGEDGENGSGLDICVGWAYWPIWSLNSNVSKTVQGWMDSPGHRRNLLDPAHTILNVGIAHDRHNIVMVQHFSSDYVRYSTRPTLDERGVLQLEATVNRATLILNDTVSITVQYHPPPKTLTDAQLSDTYSLCLSQRVAWIAEPLPPGWHFNEPEVTTEEHSIGCVDPYHSTTYTGPAENPDEAHRRWELAKAKSDSEATQKISVRRIVAQVMDANGHHIRVSADLARLLNELGPGIYTVTLWGRPDHMQEPTALSSQAIFWGTEPPAGNPYSKWAGTAPSAATGKANLEVPRTETTGPTPGVTERELQPADQAAAEAEERELQLAHQIAAERARMIFEPKDFGLVTHDSLERGFTIKLPDHWNATLGTDKTQFRAPDTETDMLVIEHREMDRIDFINQYETEVIDPAGGPPRYYEMSWETNPNGAHYWEIHSGRQESPTHCAQEGYTRVYQSQNSAGGPVTTIIGYTLCVEAPLEQFQEMTEILDSFTVIRTWPERGADIPLNVIQVATSTPHPTPTSIPKPVPTRASIPRPAPTRAPTPTPDLTAIPTPTPVPAPVLELYDNSDWKEYTILFPTGWTVQPGLELTSFTSPDGRLSMEIGRHPIQHGTSLAGFADEYRQELLKQAPGWNHFTEKSARGGLIPAGHAVITTFDRRKTATDCTEDGITHLLRSKFFPKRSMGYSVTVTLCQEDLQKWQEIRDQMMESFTEKLTEE